MRTESNILPAPVDVKSFPSGMSEIVFCENVKSEQRETDYGYETVYTYDEYRKVVPSRENLSDSVGKHMAEWLEKAKREEYDNLAAKVREKRDALLRESDAAMCLDRMNLSAPKSTTFSAWISFLQQLSDCLSGEWAEYRQKLRDVPQQDGFPYTVVFPSKPKTKII